MSYEVKRGDTLWSIARNHGISLAELMRLNGYTMADAPYLQIGAVLNTGGSSSVTAPSTSNSLASVLAAAGSTNNTTTPTNNSLGSVLAAVGAANNTAATTTTTAPPSPNQQTTTTPAPAPAQTQPVAPPPAEADPTSPWDTEGFRPPEDSPLWDDELMSFYAQYGLDQSSAETLAQQERDRLMAQANRYFGEWSGSYMEDDPSTPEDESLIATIDGNQATIAQLIDPALRDRATGEYGIAEETSLRETGMSYSGRGMGFSGSRQRALSDIRGQTGRQVLSLAGQQSQSLQAAESDLTQSRTQLELDRLGALRSAAERADLRRLGA